MVISNWAILSDQEVKEMAMIMYNLNRNAKIDGGIYKQPSVIVQMSKSRCEEYSRAQPVTQVPLSRRADAKKVRCSPPEEPPPRRVETTGVFRSSPSHCLPSHSQEMSSSQPDPSAVAAVLALPLGDLRR
ncbi:hypothetical protein Droror1_Dr00027345 [Drosera rotundifolia]